MIRRRRRLREWVAGGLIAIAASRATGERIVGSCHVPFLHGLNVSINGGEPMRFGLDTGLAAAAFSIAPEQARILGLPIIGHRRVPTSDKQPKDVDRNWTERNEIIVFPRKCRSLLIDFRYGLADGKPMRRRGSPKLLSFPPHSDGRMMTPGEVSSGSLTTFRQSSQSRGETPAPQKCAGLP
jgi:hypothetical protein